MRGKKETVQLYLSSTDQLQQRQMASRQVRNQNYKADVLLWQKSEFKPAVPKTDAGPAGRGCSPRAAEKVQSTVTNTGLWAFSSFLGWNLKTPGPDWPEFGPKCWCCLCGPEKAAIILISDLFLKQLCVAIKRTGPKSVRVGCQDCNSESLFMSLGKH